METKVTIVCNYFFSWPGQAHDARVWQKSPISARLADLCYVEGLRLEDSYHILGDTAYPLSNYLITPYRIRGGRLGTEKKKFNTHLASKRLVIERAFGLLGLRFPRLLKLKCKNHDKQILCVVACCVLHNWCLMEDNNDISSFDAMDELETDGHLGLPAAAVLGNTVDCGSGTHKRPVVQTNS